MPIRTASLSKQIKKNGARLHLAMQSRGHAPGVDHAASEAEQSLLDERRSLKEAAAQRQAELKQPKKKPVKVLKEAKPPKAPKAAKPPKEPKAAKAPKDSKAAKGSKPSRADKVAKKAENLEAAKQATRKSAKT